MKNNILKIGFIALFLYSVEINYAQNMPDTYSEYTSGKLEYGLFVPENYDTSKSYPLVMFLHGWSNNYTVYLNFYNKEIQQQNPCFVYTPKTPVDWGDWSGWSWDGTGFSSLSKPTQTAILMLDSIIAKYTIDTNRLYVYGISMGGEGVFDLLHKMPYKFAAGISICGGGNANWADKISSTPLWMFHGGADDINPPDLTERVYKSLLEIGATKMRYTNYPGYGHSIWDKAQSEPSFYDWMFAFDKSQKKYILPQGKINLTGTVSDKINLKWNDIRNDSVLSEKIWYYNIFNSEGKLATVEYNDTNYSFTSENSIDTFKIQAVNYCFEKSEFSNTLYFSEGKIATSLPKHIDKKKVRIVKNNNSIFIYAPDNITTAVSVQLVSLEGKKIFSKKYHHPNQIVLDMSGIAKKMFILNVTAENQSYTEKLMFY